MITSMTRVLLCAVVALAVLSLASGLPCTIKLIELGQSSTTLNIASTASSVLQFNINNPNFARDGIYGTASSLTVGDARPDGYIGYQFSTPQVIRAVAWSSDNTNNSPRTAYHLWDGLYEIEITSPALNDNWLTIASINYNSKELPLLNSRHKYSIDCSADDVAEDLLKLVTGIRLVAPAGNVLDEFEVYSSLAEPYTTSGCKALLSETGGNGYASRTSATGNPTVVADGIYGNAPTLTVGTIPQLTFAAGTYSTVAFGLDNTDLDGDKRTASLGTYIIEAFIGGSWVAVDAVQNFGSTELPSPSRRHAFTIQCTSTSTYSGIRVRVPQANIGSIDEIEIYSATLNPVTVTTTVNSLISGTSVTAGTVTGNSGIPYGVFVSSPSVGVTFIPNPVPVSTALGVQSFNAICNVIGPVTIQFGTTANPTLYGSKITYCYGNVRFATTAPTRVTRGSTFSLDLELVPPPTSAVEILVRTSNNLVSPSVSRVFFGIGQTRSSVRFNSPLLNYVGDVTVTFTSRSIFDYATLTHTIRVVGTLTTSIVSPLKLGITSSETLQLVPPQPFDGWVDNANNVFNHPSSYVAINATQFATVTPSNMTFVSGSTGLGSFTILPFNSGRQNITFVSDYYETLVVTVDVLGSIFAAVPSSFTVDEVTRFEVSLQPTPKTALTLTVQTDSRVSAPATISFAANQKTSVIEVSSLFVGDTTFIFSAPGYATLTRTSFVQLPALCASQLAPNSEGECTLCPLGSNGLVCSGHGTCVASELFHRDVVCSCNSNVGRSCEYSKSGASTGVKVFDFVFPATGASGLFHLVNAAQLPTLSISVPAGVFPKFNDPLNGGAGSLLLESINDQYTSASGFHLLDARVSLPISDNYVFTAVPTNVAPGFIVDVVSSDNHGIFEVSPPLRLTYNFAPKLMSIEQLSRATLYYNFFGEWVLASETCTPISTVTPSIDTFSQSLSVCYTGQYQYFYRTQVPGTTDPFVAPAVPIPVDPARDIGNDIATTTGASGLLPVPPQRPPFPEGDALFNAEPNRNPLQTSSAGVLNASFAMLVIIAVLSLLF